MRNKKAFVMGMLLVLLLPLCGCQLAKGDAQNMADDRLIGVFITDGYLDLFDFEGYINDNIGSFSGGEIVVGNESQYSGRIYAELETKYVTSSDNEPMDVKEFVFKNLEGVPFFFANIPMDAPHGPYRSTSSGDAISEASFYMGDEVKLEGTIYAAPGREQAFYLNPVYQTEDGSVYLTSGTGLATTSVDYGEGQVMSQTMEETYTNSGGEKRTESILVTVHMAVKYAPVKVVVAQMNAKNEEISREEYAAGSLPEHIARHPQAAYFIVETHAKAGNGQEQIAREMLEPSVDGFTSYTEGENGILLPKFTEIRP